MNGNKNWFSVEVLVKTAATEAIESALNELDALGTEIDILGQKQIPENTKVIGYFNELIDDEILHNKIYEFLSIYDFSDQDLISITWQQVENKDWLAEWKKHWKPTETDKFIIAPTWSEVITNKHLIRIEPSMAFGTGTHETTKLCLKKIEEIYQGNETFFDVGTGTGILAIAVAKLGGTEILGCDTDEDSIKIATENTELNEVADIKLYVGSITPDSPEFDFVCANLTADIIILLLPLLVAKAKKRLLLSGILVEQKDTILSELKKFGIENAEIETDGEWISVYVEL
jgi:ribosomal protein L11 methyltransferase